MCILVKTMGDNGLAEQLWEAVEDGDEANVRRLLKKGANPNYTSSYNPSSAVSGSTIQLWLL
jgi:hypothetical protein